MLSSELIIDVGALDGLRSEWDELAVACALPLMAPATVMAWWRHLAPPRAEPRSVVVRDGKQLVGLAPFYAVPGGRQRVDYRLPGIELAARLSPLATAGREWEVAGEVTQALAASRPRPDLIALEGHPIASQWPAALRDSWPGALRPVLRQYVTQGAPTVSLQQPTFEDWLSGKSANFRSQMRRMRRRFTADGGVARVSTQDTIVADIDIFMSLHTARWEKRGDSGIVAMGERYTATIEEMARSHLKDGRFRLWMLELQGTPISAQLFIGAGGEVAYINGGWDERFAHLKPAMLGILYAIEDAFAHSHERMDLGAGALPYKQRFADGSDPVAWNILVVPGSHLPLTVIRTAPMLARSALRDKVKRALSAEQAERLRGLRDKLTR
ncbi:MAG: GNAT family N-acetyltransferase [Solirubrobacteraceae bacterium]